LPNEQLRRHNEERSNEAILQEKNAVATLHSVARNDNVKIFF
jgi:hypothetical protein